MANEQEKQPKDEFEEIVSALLKVNPEGISGKHRKPRTRENDDEPGESGQHSAG
jgi:hypothetical protein